MFCHLILGLLRDGRARHAYELVSEYRGVSASPVNAGNIYRECSKLRSQRLIVAADAPGSADPRRIPYCITENGCREFDAWLLDPTPIDGGFGTWIMFADMLAPADRSALIESMQEELWMENKRLVKARESQLARARRFGVNRYRPGSFLLLRRIKQTTADLELLDELRHELGEVPPASVTVSSKRHRSDPQTAG